MVRMNMILSLSLSLIDVVVSNLFKRMELNWNK